MKRYDWVCPSMPDTVGWKARHLRAVHGAHPVAVMLRAWCAYAEEHREKFESDIGHDYLLGPHWARLGKALHGLLNGDTGGLDCGTLSSIIQDNLDEQGYNFEHIS